MLKFDKKTVSKLTKAEVRERMMSAEESAFVDVVRKTRGEKIPEQWKHIIADFWEKEASHETTDSNRGEVKKRIGTKEYLCHRRQIMTKTYREAYAEFRNLNPEVRQLLEGANLFMCGLQMQETSSSAVAKSAPQLKKLSVPCRVLRKDIIVHRILLTTH